MTSEPSSVDPIERFRSIYVENYLAILGYALRRTATEDDAADVVADTFLVLWRRLDQAPEGDETRPWLYGIARRVLSNAHRGDRRRGRLLARLMTTTPSDISGSNSSADVVVRALERLSERDREVLRLATWEELGPAEIAIALGCTVNAAKLRLHRARRRFAFQLGLLGIGVKPRAGTGHEPPERFALAREEEHR
jgi:RNA polymerase sigma factor (sigma-70 family)